MLAGGIGCLSDLTYWHLGSFIPNVSLQSDSFPDSSGETSGSINYKLGLIFLGGFMEAPLFQKRYSSLLDLLPVASHAAKFLRLRKAFNSDDVYYIIV